MTTMWGIHNDVFGRELVDGNFISVGWYAVGDLRVVGNDRERMKAALERAYPGSNPRAIPVQAGVLLRFAFEMQVGDLVVAPYKPDSTLNFGVVDGPYEYLPEGGRHPHRRRVRWLRTGVARGGFPQPALYEIGSAVTLFRIRRHADVFERFIVGGDGEAVVDDTSPAEVGLVEADLAVQDEPNAERIGLHTSDFIANTLLHQLSHEEFEHFTADLLRAMGYEARVTAYGADGGIDVIAHKDKLGLEPPIIKVQCKHSTATRSRPDVQQLLGTLASNELGLFVSLGSYSKDALSLEREKQNLRLFGGADVTRLVIEHYDGLAPRWRALMPLRRVLVVDREPEIG